MIFLTKMKKTYIAPNATAVRLFAEEDLLTMSMGVSTTEKNGTDVSQTKRVVGTAVIGRRLTRTNVFLCLLALLITWRNFCGV